MSKIFQNSRIYLNKGKKNRPYSLNEISPRIYLYNCEKLTMPETYRFFSVTVVMINFLILLQYSATFSDQQTGNRRIRRAEYSQNGNFGFLKLLGFREKIIRVSWQSLLSANCCLRGFFEASMLAGNLLQKNFGKRQEGVAILPDIRVFEKFGFMRNMARVETFLG